MKRREVWNLTCAGFLIMMCFLFPITVDRAYAGTLKLPEHIQVIEDEAFLGDTALENVEIPNSIVRIESRAFLNNGLTEIMLPSSVQFVADDAFDMSVFVYMQDSLCPIQRIKKTINGLTFSPDRIGGYTLNGTPTINTQYNLYNSKTALLKGIEPGGSYYTDYWSADIAVGLHISTYSADGGKTQVLKTVSPAYFTIPTDAVGININLYVFAEATQNGYYVKPRIFPAQNANPSLQSPPPMLSIIYDDGFTDFYDYILPVILDKNVPIATAVMPDQMEGGVPSYLMTWNQIKECYAMGAEVLNHCGVHSKEEWNRMGADQIERMYRAGWNTILSQGISMPNTLVFAGASSSYAVCRMAASRVYGCGFRAGGNQLNLYGQFDPYYIARYNTDGQSLETLTGWLDELSQARTGWMVWMRHNADPVYDPVECAAILSAAIDYALEKNIRIVTVAEGLSNYLWE